MVKRISPTPSGTVEAGAVYPLAAQVEYEQKVQPVTIVSSLDTKGKQQPFTVAEETGLIDSLDAQGGSVSISNGGFGFSDSIDCSLHDGILLFNWLRKDFFFLKLLFLNFKSHFLFSFIPSL